MFSNQYGQKCLYQGNKIETEVLEFASERVIQKTTEATGDLIKDQISGAIVSRPGIVEKQYSKSTEIYLSNRFESMEHYIPKGTYITLES